MASRFLQRCLLPSRLRLFPSIGEDYFAIRECVLWIRMYEGWEHNPLRCLRVEDRIKPLTTLAWGEGSLAKWLARTGHAVILEAGDFKDKYRIQVRQTYADQGTEKGIGQAPNIFLWGKPVMSLPGLKLASWGRTNWMQCRRECGRQRGIPQGTSTSCLMPSRRESYRCRNGRVWSNISAL